MDAMATKQPRKSSRFSRWRENRKMQAARSGNPGDGRGSVDSGSMGGAVGSSACLLSILLASDVHRVRAGR
jgi:hypothetical protein